MTPSTQKSHRLVNMLVGQTLERVRFSSFSTRLCSSRFDVRSINHSHRKPNGNRPEYPKNYPVSKCSIITQIINMINNIVYDRNYGPDEYVCRPSRKHTRHDCNKTACIIIRAYEFNDLKNQKETTYKPKK